MYGILYIIFLQIKLSSYKKIKIKIFQVETHLAPRGECHFIRVNVILEIKFIAFFVANDSSAYMNN